LRFSAIKRSTFLPGIAGLGPAVIDSSLIRLKSATISLSRKFFDQVFHLIGHERGRFFVAEL
jgi:hypothetical protein